MRGDFINPRQNSRMAHSLREAQIWAVHGCCDNLCRPRFGSCFGCSVRLAFAGCALVLVGPLVCLVCFFGPFRPCSASLLLPLRYEFTSLRGGVNYESPWLREFVRWVQKSPMANSRRMRSLLFLVVGGLFRCCFAARLPRLRGSSPRGSPGSRPRLPCPSVRDPVYYLSPR